MAETLSSGGNSDAEADLDAIRSRLQELSEMQAGALHVSPEIPDSGSQEPVEECLLVFQRLIRSLESEETEIDSLGPEDLDIYMKRTKEKLCHTEDENMKICQEIAELKEKIENDSALFDGGLESLSWMLKFVDYQTGLIQDGMHNDTLGVRDMQECQVDTAQDYKFKIMELDQKIEKNKHDLNILHDLDSSLRRSEMIGHIEDTLSSFEVLETKDNYIKLSLRTPIPVNDIALSGYDFTHPIEPSLVNHELLIEFVDGTAELKNVEIFPADVSIEDVVLTAKTSSLFFLYYRLLSSSTIEFSLGRLVRQIQGRIVLCKLRCYLVLSANKSRHSFEYSDRDEKITVHMVGGIDCFLESPHGWPLSSSGLTLISLKNNETCTATISLVFLCKVKGMANSLDRETRSHLIRFADAIEDILTREMSSEIDPA